MTTDPHRLVDADGRTWDRVDTAPGRYVTRALGGATPLVRPQIELRSGPTRPVVPLPPADREHLTGVLTELADRAPHKLMTTVCAAIADAYRHAGPRNPLIAGRPGSWEATTLAQIYYGPGQELRDQVNRGGPSTDDVDTPAMLEISGIIVGWVTTPGRFVEVAENLAAILGPVIDHAGGWRAVAGSLIREPRGHEIRSWATSLSNQPS